MNDLLNCGKIIPFHVTYQTILNIEKTVLRNFLDFVYHFPNFHCLY